MWILYIFNLILHSVFLWIFIGRTDAEAPILWPPDAKSWLLRKAPDGGKDWRQEKGTTGDEMVGWHHWLDGNEFGQAPGLGDGQGGPICCSPWGCKESDTTEPLNSRIIAKHATWSAEADVWLQGRSEDEICLISCLGAQRAVFCQMCNAGK